MVEIHSIFYFCWGHQLLSYLPESVKSQTPGRKERTMFTPPRTGVPLGTGGVSSWMQTRRGAREAISVLSFQVNKPRNLCWVLTSPSHTFFFTVHLTNITVHQSLIFLRESLVTENELKSSFSKHIAFGHPWLNTKSGGLYSLQPKMEKLYTVSKNKTGSWLWLSSWTPYCQIQT